MLEEEKKRGVIKAIWIIVLIILVGGFVSAVDSLELDNFCIDFTGSHNRTTGDFKLRIQSCDFRSEYEGVIIEDNGERDET